MKKQVLDKLISDGNGFITTEEVIKEDISKTYFYNYAKKHNLIRASHGVYMVGDAWADQLFIIQIRYPSIVFSNETALFLLDMAEREPLKVSLTMDKNKYSSALTKEGVKVFKVGNNLIDLGVIKVQTHSGNFVNCYNQERTICDLVRSKNVIEIQTLQVALKEYIKSPQKNLALLMDYAKQLKVEKTLRQYLEVLL